MSRAALRYQRLEALVHRRRWRLLIPGTLLGIVIWIGGVTLGGVNGAVLLGAVLMLTGCLWLAWDLHRLDGALRDYEEEPLRVLLDDMRNDARRSGRERKDG